MIDSTKTVREIAVEVPGATRIFEKLGIDYCCGGAKPLRDACVQARVPLEDVLRTLEAGNKPVATPDSAVLEQGSLRDLVEHIVSRHHAFVKQEIPRIQQLLAKVVAVHGKGHPELPQVQQKFQALSGELISHMMKEENILFPYISALEEAVSTGRPAPRPMFGTVSNPVRMMEMEHDSAGNLEKEIRAATSNYIPPDEACFSYRTLYTALQGFEADLHQHIHLENNILFPRAIELEAQAAPVGVR
jgi:regulator of cell morphogenesis and NO signaling